MDPFALSSAIVAISALLSAVLLWFAPAYYEKLLNRVLPDKKPLWVYIVLVLFFVWAIFLWVQFPSDLHPLNALICLVISFAFIKMILLVQRYVLFRQIVLSVIESDKIARIILAVCSALVGAALLFVSSRI